MVNSQKEPQQGAIIVATHTGEGIVGAATVKTFFHERDYVRLQLMANSTTGFLFRAGG
jgi:SOS-response transcriptional repressor LexA